MTVVGLIAMVGGYAFPVTAGPESTAGHLLIAAPEMPDNPFSKTVILMIRHDDTGAFGLTISRPVEEGPLAEILGIIGAAHGFSEAVRRSDRSISVRSGGPVQEDLAFLIHGDETHPDSEEVLPGVFVTGDLTPLERFAEPDANVPAFLVIGYAGWGPGQLEAEFARGDWETLTPDRDLVFNIPPTELWDAVVERLPIDI